MRIQYSESTRANTIGGVPCHFQTDQAVTWLPRAACVMAGFTDAELDAAEASPGDWIDCPRDNEEATEKRLATLKAKCDCVKLQVKLKAVTDQRDRLLKACKILRTRVATLEDPGCKWSDFLDADDVDAAIADVEKT